MSDNIIKQRQTKQNDSKEDESTTVVLMYQSKCAKIGNMLHQHFECFIRKVAKCAIHIQLP